MYKVAIMGDRDSIYGFAALGIEIFPITDSSVAAKTLKTLAQKEYAVIYITEALAAKMPDIISEYDDLLTPAIILIPGITGNTGDGMRNVSKAVEKAVGSDIIA